MLEKLKSKRNNLLIWRWICYVAAICCCVIPTIMVVRMAMPSIKTSCNWLGISAFGICMAGIVVLMVAKGVVRELTEKLPFTVGVLISEVVVLGILIGLESIIKDAILIFKISAIGAGTGLIFNIAARYLNAEAQIIKEKIHKIEVENE